MVVYNTAIMNTYNLSKQWFEFCADNMDKIKPAHTALYFYCIDLCNKFRWKKEFYLPTTHTMSILGIHSYNTYKVALKDLIEFGFITMVKKSTNQYNSNIIALSKFDEAN